jgi:hypothetical protein
VELDFIYKNVSVNEFSVKRCVDSFTVKFTFSSTDKDVDVELFGVRDSSDLCEILSADRLWVERTDGNQTEFGSFLLGVSHEYYTEIVFDNLGVQGL